MRQFLGGRSLGQMGAFFLIFLSLLSELRPVHTRGLLDDGTVTDCAIRGKEAAEEAAEFACFKVKVRCLSPAQRRKLDTPAIDYDLFDDMDFACRRIAETSCQTDSRQSVSAEDRVCADLLMLGPSRPIPGCVSVPDAIEEFNWSVREYCNQEVEIFAPDSAPAIEEMD